MPPLLPGQMGAGDLLEMFRPFHLSLGLRNRACRDDPGLFVSSILPIYTKSLFPKVTSWQCLSRGTCPVMQLPDETAMSPTEETSSTREWQIHLPSLGIKAPWQFVMSSHEKTQILLIGMGSPCASQRATGKWNWDSGRGKILEGRIDARNS